MGDTIIGIVGVLFLLVLSGVVTLEIWERDDDSLLISWAKVVAGGVCVFIVLGLIVVIGQSWGRAG